MRYEVFVGRHLSPATLATFPVALVPTAVPRHTVRRLRVGADRDITDIVRRLTESGIEILEIRWCPQRPRWRPRRRQGGTGPADDEAASGVVVALPHPRGDGRIAAEPEGEPVLPISLGRSFARDDAAGAPAERALAARRSTRARARHKRGTAPDDADLA
jgi:hypothetical protein